MNAVARLIFSALFLTALNLTNAIDCTITDRENSKSFPGCMNCVDISIWSRCTWDKKTDSCVETSTIDGSLRDKNIKDDLQATNKDHCLNIYADAKKCDGIFAKISSKLLYLLKDQTIFDYIGGKFSDLKSFVYLSYKDPEVMQAARFSICNLPNKITSLTLQLLSLESTCKALDDFQKTKLDWKDVSWSIVTGVLPWFDSISKIAKLAKALDNIETIVGFGKAVFDHKDPTPTTKAFVFKQIRDLNKFSQKLYKSCNTLTSGLTDGPEGVAFLQGHKVLRVVSSKVYAREAKDFVERVPEYFKLIDPKFQITTDLIKNPKLFLTYKYLRAFILEHRKLPDSCLTSDSNLQSIFDKFVSNLRLGKIDTIKEFLDSMEKCLSNIGKFSDKIIGIEKFGE